MNKMFGTDIHISFTPGAAMPQVGSQIAAEFAAGQSAASDVYIGADSYLTPLVKRKIFHEVEWPKFLPGRITNEMVEGERTSLRVYTGIPGHSLQHQAHAEERSAEKRSKTCSSRIGKAKSLRRPT